MSKLHPQRAAHVSSSDMHTTDKCAGCASHGSQRFESSLGDDAAGSLPSSPMRFKSDSLNTEEAPTRAWYTLSSAAPEDAAAGAAMQAPRPAEIDDEIEHLRTKISRSWARRLHNASTGHDLTFSASSGRKLSADRDTWQTCCGGRAVPRHHSSYDDTLQEGVAVFCAQAPASATKALRAQHNTNIVNTALFELVAQ